MQKLPEVIFLPEQKKISVKPGTTLLEAARRAKVHIRTRCGGKAACLMCKVLVEDPSNLSPMNTNEQNKLGAWKDQSYRLACQARVKDDVRVTVPEDPLKAAIRRKLAEQQADDLF